MPLQPVTLSPLSSSKFLPGPLVVLMDDGVGGKRQKICFPAVSPTPDLIDCLLQFDGSLSNMMGLSRSRAAPCWNTRSLPRRVNAIASEPQLQDLELTGCDEFHGTP